MELKQVAPGKIVEMKYELRDEQGSTLEVMDEQWPLKFLFGEGAMLPAFESELLGLEEGMRFEFTLNPEQAYGVKDPNQQVKVFRNDLQLGERYPYETLDVEDHVQLITTSNEQYAGMIIEKHDDYLVVDCNHAMAGKTLHFTGQILFIRDARKDEAEAKRYIEPNGFRSHSPLTEPPNQ